MTEREQFEEKFPVPSETVWSDHLSAYVQKNRRVLSAYDDLWQVWQEAAKIRFRSPTAEESDDSDAAWYRLVTTLDRAPLSTYDAFRFGYMQAWQAARATAPEGMAIVPVDVLDDVVNLAGYSVTHTEFNSSLRRSFIKCCDLLAATKEKGE